MATSVVSGRVDVAVRQRADAVMRKAGLKPTEIIQAVWTAIATTGEIPDVARPAACEGGDSAAMDKLVGFLDSLPPINPEFAGLSEDDILALKVADHV